MSDLTSIDLRLLERAFAMEGGYVLDFSNRTLSEFFEMDLNADIDDARWSGDGSSKGRRVKRFLRDVDNRTAVRTIQALWNYRAATGQTNEDGCEGPIHDLISRLSGGAVQTGVQPPVATRGPQVAQLRQQLMDVWGMQPQQRGYAFEGFLTGLFNLYGLRARDRFRVVGEEIDGSFELDNAAYLLEAKWHATAIGVSDLHVFEGKLQQRAQWARGLFVSYNGFSEDGLVAFGRGKRTICMSGQDFDEMLGRQLPINAVIAAKARAAVETGNPYVLVRDLRL